MSGGIGGHHSAKARSEDWITPKDVIEALGGAQSFDLDPCAAVGQPWPTARASFTIKDNGLLQRWHGRVWLNPPYSTDKIGKFMGRLAAYGRGTALVFARTETAWFFDEVWARATALLFMKTPRLHFHRVDGSRAPHNCGAPTVLCAYGQADADVLQSCGIPGQFVPLQKIERARKRHARHHGLLRLEKVLQPLGSRLTEDRECAENS